MASPDLQVRRNVAGVLATSPTYEITVTPTLTTHANYAANDYVGTDNVPMEFTHVSRIPGGGGFLTVVLIDDVVASVAGELWLFDTTVVPPDDSAAWSITDAEAKTLVGIIPFSTYYASAANSVAMSANNPIPFKCAEDSTSLFGCFVTRGAPGYNGDVIHFRMYVMPND